VSGSFDPVLSCPLKPAHAVEILVRDRVANPLGDILVRLMLSPEQTHDAVTESNGVARFEGLHAGSYLFTLPELDRDAWQPVSQAALTFKEDDCRGDLDWNPPREIAQPQSPYRAKPGDCLAIIGFRLGFLPDTIWQYAENVQLRKDRDSLYVINPGDEVAIPRRRLRNETIPVSHRAIVRLPAVPERLRIRFLEFDLTPRAGVPYLLSITTERGEPVPDREGKTDSDGFLTEPIPPDAVTGEIWLGKGKDREVIPVSLGEVRPVEVEAGLYERLNALGIPCDPAADSEDAEESQIEEALAEFQGWFDLTPTGKADAATQAKLREAYLS
jgi:hypothetical protein